MFIKINEYFPDYLLASSRTFLRFFGQPLSKQLYTSSQRLVIALNILGAIDRRGGCPNHLPQKMKKKAKPR